MDRRTFLGCLAAPALAPLLPAKPAGFIASGAMVGYADLSDFPARLADCASVTGYIYGIKRTGELVFTVNFPPADADVVRAGAGSTAGPAAFWR